MADSENPYHYATPAFVVDPTESINRFRFATWLVAYLFPVWFVASFYMTWLIAWIQLGHIPRPMLDDPQSIGGLMDIAYLVPGLMFLLMPVLTPLGLVASFFCPLRKSPSHRFSNRALHVALYVALCAFALVFLREDPGQVVEWWID